MGRAFPLDRWMLQKKVVKKKKEKLTQLTAKIKEGVILRRVSLKEKRIPVP